MAFTPAFSSTGMFCSGNGSVAGPDVFQNLPDRASPRFLVTLVVGADGNTHVSVVDEHTDSLAAGISITVPKAEDESFLLGRGAHLPPNAIVGLALCMKRIQGKQKEQRA